MHGRSRSTLWTLSVGATGIVVARHGTTSVMHHVRRNLLTCVLELVAQQRPHTVNVDG